MPHIQARRGEFFLDDGTLANRARDQATRLLRVIIVVRAKPALKDMAMLALQIENFQSHASKLGSINSISSR
jgi:hypothetical protein